MKFKKTISSSESYYEMDNGIICKKGGGAQAAYNLPIDFFEYAIFKEILVMNKTIIDLKYNDDGPYSLNDEYKFELGEGIKWIINNNSSNIKFVVYKSSTNQKILLYKTVYKQLGKEYEWFVSLYDRNLYNNELIIELDEEKKVLKLDVEFYNVTQNINNNYTTNIERKIKSYNRIFFGAPGTGKSYLLNKEAIEYFKNNIERVTFYPNYTYGSFVGAYKPFPIIDKDGKESITYKYVKGNFIRILLKASLKPKENFVLIIEEINRANVSMVFGDIFQLLDRNSEGFSDYFINCSEELVQFLSEELNTLSTEQKNYIKSVFGDEYDKLRIPANLYIWATMNSADQGVMPLDTAFKRRWEFEYIDINNGVEDAINKYKINTGISGEVSWNIIREAINKKLVDCRVEEDRLLGLYFISKNILDTLDTDKITKIFTNKVLMYLYEDIGRQNRFKIFEEKHCKTFYDLCLNFKDENIGINVFKDGLNIPNIIEINK